MDFRLRLYYAVNIISQYADGGEKVVLAGVKIQL